MGPTNNGQSLGSRITYLGRNASHKGTWLYLATSENNLFVLGSDELRIQHSLELLLESSLSLLWLRKEIEDNEGVMVFVRWIRSSAPMQPRHDGDRRPIRLVDVIGWRKGKVQVLLRMK